MASMVPFFLLINIFLNCANGELEMDIPIEQNAFDLNLYKSVLNPSLCVEQLEYLMFNNTMLLAEFLDAGGKIPRGVLTGNYVDLGNYFQCLNIHQEMNNSAIDGKYCMVTVPLDQSEFKFPMMSLLGLDLPDFLANVNFSSVGISEQSLNLKRKHAKLKFGDMVADKHNRSSPDRPLSGLHFQIGVCIPKSCSSQQIVDELMDRTASVGFEFKEMYCRLPNDKPWVTADYLSWAVFSVIGLITLLSTTYDICHTIILGREPQKANKIYQSFSIYTNTRRLVTYTSTPGAIECLDGVRTLAITWVIIGHTFSVRTASPMGNGIGLLEWLASLSSLWIIAGPITVDTFFMLSGLLLVYTVAGKLTRSQLFKNLHMFYLLRVLRIFPILTIAILMQASLFNHVSDGPNWDLVAEHVHRCRQFWWTTLLHVQNFLNPGHICLDHTWFLAIDMQLHILSPLVLFWLLSGNKKAACLALTVAMLLGLVPATVYNFIKKFPSSHIVLSNFEQQPYFMVGYYVNILTRCSPYIVGMLFGYLLHVYRDKKVVIPKILVATLWIFATITSMVVIYAIHPVTQLDWDNPTVDAIVNSFMRPSWALALGWLVFACTHGYGGPVNWILSLRVWKVPSRLSYAMYIVHYPIIINAYSSITSATYFSVNAYLCKFMSDFCMTIAVAFVLTLLVDSPCSTLIKLYFGKGFGKPQDDIKGKELTDNKTVNDSTYNTHV